MAITMTIACWYLQAFLMLRQYRLNLNLLYDHNPTVFEANM